MEVTNIIRGISFRITQTMDNVILWPIFECINVKKYKWYNIASQNEVWSDSFGNNLFDKNYYDGKSFYKQIKLKQYIVFIKLQAYWETGEFGEIHTYEEFLESDCQILLLINDCEFVEIYAKDPIIIESIFTNATTNNYEDIEYITDDNDGRTKMDVL